MADNCEHTVCLDFSFFQEKCLDLNFYQEECLDLCIPGKGLNLAFCDIISLGFEDLDTCDITIDSIDTSGKDIVVTASSSKTLFYALLDSNGDEVVNHQLSNTFTDVEDGTYLIQVSDENDCNQYQFYTHEEEIV